jgi:hypothetical protein
MTYKKTPKNAEKFICEDCNFVSSKKSDYERHLMTRKHKILTNTYKKNAENAEYICVCGKQYKHRQSLHNHRIRCNFEKNLEKDEKESETGIMEKIKNVENEVQNSNDYKEMFMEMMKQNHKLQQQMVELIPQVKGNTTNNTMNNFNINLFLNEQCKDALNIMDFVNSLTIELADLERTGTHGFADGISNIFVKAIQNLDITKRPIHCTDLKREVLYVKDNETWDKDSEDKQKIKGAIHTLKQNNIRKIGEWVQENPESQEMNNPKNDMYMNMLHENTGNQDKSIPKIIKNVAKNVVLPKDDNK